MRPGSRRAQPSFSRQGTTMNTLAQHAFNSNPQTVRAARDFVVGILDSWGGCARRDDIRLCVSELAGNAATHASSPGDGYLVRLTRYERCVHLEVQDTGVGSGTVAVRPLTSTDAGGRGLHIVQELSDEWGVAAPACDGKVVWTCFRRPGSKPRCSCRA